MSKLLLIESPGKLRKLAQILGKGWVIKASMGHVRELANDGEDSLGFDLNDDRIDCRYEPRGTRGQAVLAELRQAVKQADQVYIATDPGGLAESLSRGTTTKMQDPGAILAFTYMGEGTGAPIEPIRPVSDAKFSRPEAPATNAAGSSMPPQFTAAQVAAGKTAYNSNCAVCHGSTMTNGTFGTPLAGQYFQTTWTGKSLRAFYDRAHKTMPPAAPGSLPKDSYANIVAYILDLNGFKSGDTPLAAGGEGLDKMTIK